MSGLLELLSGRRMACPSFLGLLLAVTLTTTSGALAGTFTIWTNSVGTPVKLQQWDLNGNLLQTITAPHGSDGRGIVQVGNILYYTSANTNSVFAYNFAPNATNPDLGTVFTVAGATGLATMAYDGSSFYLGDYSGTNTVYKYSSTGVLQGTISLANCSSYCDGLEYANGTLISNRRDSFGPYDVYNLTGGTPTISALITDPTANIRNTGIAFDGTNYFVARIDTPEILVFDINGIYQSKITLNGAQYVEDISVNYEEVLGDGFLKVCKVAGPGVPVGTPFTFTTTPGWTFQIPAGAGSGGNCWVGGIYPLNTQVTVTEAPTTGYGVSSITAVPPASLNSYVLATGTANVTIGPGVTEVTYTDNGTGYLEICKFSETPGNYTFTLNPGGQTVVVPNISCSPAIQVTAGPVVITETSPNTGLVYCYQWSGTWTVCPVSGQTATVTVNPGDSTTQTVALLFNSKDDVNAARAARSSNSAMGQVLKRLGVPPPPSR